MNNSIFKNQNDKYLLKCLAAQRKEYSFAKKADTCKNVMTVALAFFSILSSAIDNDMLSAILCLFAISILIASRHVDTYILKHRKHAALIQQYFDVKLFNSVIGQGTIKWGPLPTKTDLAESISAVDDFEVEQVKNWYSDYSDLNPVSQVFYCQKENIRWDSEIRSEFKWLIVCVCSILLIVLMVIAFAINPSIIKCISVLAWFLPIADYCLSFIINLRKDINRLEKIKEQSKDVEKLLSNNSLQQSYDELSKLQHQIMDNRENATLVPDWFYHLRKNRHQKNEDKIADTIQNMSNKPY